MYTRNTPEDIPSRGEVSGFAMRTRKNLEYVISAHEQGADVHVVTHLVQSLLGIIVFPYERFDSSLWGAELARLEASEWQTWNHVAGGYQPRTVGQLVRVLRHSIAHANVMFSSESRQLAEVEIRFSNTPPRGGKRWEGSIRGDELLHFCQNYLAYMSNFAD